jgi:ribonuclease Y
MIISFIFISILIPAIIGIGSLIVGGAIGYILFQFILKKQKESIIKEAETEAEVLKKERILQAKEKFLQLKSEHEKVINERNNKVVQAENRINYNSETRRNTKTEERTRYR